MGEGSAVYEGEVMEGARAMKLAGIKPVTLAAKEGLALNNGTQVMAAIGALGLLQAERLCQQADVIAAASVDALLGTPTAFDPLVHILSTSGTEQKRQQPFNLLQNSPLRESHRNCDNVQDAYSCAAHRRCMERCEMRLPMPEVCWRSRSTAPQTTHSSSPMKTG